MRHFLKVTSYPMRWGLVTFFWLWVGLAGALAHSSDFVFARWSQDELTGGIELSLSLQITDNPNIDTREQALEVLTSLIQVSGGDEGGYVPLAEVAVASFRDDISFPQDSPVPIGGAGLEELESGEVTEDEVKKHQILTLIWKWNPAPDEKQMNFFLADDCQQYVVFWWADAQGAELAPGKEVPWQILLGGDESFSLGLKMREVDNEETVEAGEVEEAEKAGIGGLVFSGALVILLLACLVFVMRKRSAYTRMR
ncbi:MAG: hypothetical protein QM496_03265 [Verrucomicrobiota bacterium]